MARVQRAYNARISMTSPFRLEHLESRRMLCWLHVGIPDLLNQPTTELRPDLVNSKGQPIGPEVADPANIVWTNRANTTAGGAGDTDGFGGTFGTLAPIARAVVDAVIVSYERMIGSFNYSLAGQTYSLSLSMAGSGSGFGASAGLSTSLGGKPKSGSISLGAGNNDGNANSDNGWFIDPTPFDSSEFLGNIINAYSGDAQAGSPALGKSDFFTVIAAEMTHCMGLFGNALGGWAALTHDTGVHDSATGVGNLWVFDGPSIKHLMTSDNGGVQDFGSAVHSGEPPSTTVYPAVGGVTYVATHDQGNAFYESSRRYMINNAFSLMFKDAYGYLSVNPDQFGSTYSTLNETTSLVTVRGGDFAGGAGVSNDLISITRTGSTISVSVDVSNDLPGTGALPGAGNLPAFVTKYDISQVSSISINAGSGVDNISIAADVGVPISVVGGSAADTLTVEGTAGADAYTIGASTITVGSTTITNAGGLEGIFVNGNAAVDTFDVNGTTAAAPLTIDAGDESDTITVQNNAALSPVTIINSTGPDTVNVNTDNTSTAAVQFNSSMNLLALNLGAGGVANLLANGARLLSTGALSMNATALLDLFDNDLMVSPGTLSTIQNLISTARNGGAWTGNGITSTTARDNASANTALGALTGQDFKDANGGPTASFDGQSVADDAVVVKYTYNGDTDLNGTVNFDDYSRIDLGFNTQNTPGFAFKWLVGDFDFNSSINFDDYSLIDLAFNTQTGVL